MKEIIAMHGWAGDSNQWSSWIELFQCCDWKWQNADRGYKDVNPYSPKWINDINHIGETKVAICHSLGLHLIEKEILSTATHIVLINSFSRFIPSGKDNHIILLALKKMMSAINTPDEQTMLKKFFIKSYKPNPINVESNSLSISHSGRLKLKNDLNLLMNTDALPTALNTEAKVLVINSKNDFIIANQTKEKLAEDLIKSMKEKPRIIDLQEEGHSISEIKNIQKIKDWLEFDHAKRMV